MILRFRLFLFIVKKFREAAVQGGEVLDAIAHFQIAWTDDEFVDFQVANVTYSVICRMQKCHAFGDSVEDMGMLRLRCHRVVGRFWETPD